MKVKSAPKSGGLAVAESADISPAQAENPGGKPAVRCILVATDFSAASLRAVEYALRLGGPCAARLILLHVHEPAGFGTEYLALPAQRDEQFESNLRTARERLSQLEGRHVGHGVPCETLVRIGRAWSEIPETAVALGADLIVLGARGEGPVTAWRTGSTVEGVVRHARCPVVIVP